LSFPRLRRSACFRRLTGVSVATFDRMVAQLRAPWEAAERRKAKSGRPWEVGGLEDHLLIMLLYYTNPGMARLIQCFPDAALI
jgi:hypothetical protein